MRKFAGEWVSNVLQRLGMQEGEAIESKLVSRRIEGAQKKVEERNFDARKNLLEYDEVMDTQRKGVYSFRQRLLDGAPTKDELLTMIDRQIDSAVDQFLDADYGPSSFAAWVGQRLGVEFEGKDFRGDSFEDAIDRARDRGESQAADSIDEAIEENLPADAEPSEWNWIALTNWANARYSLNLKDRDLRRFAKAGQDELELDRLALANAIREPAIESIRKTDLDPAREFLAADWGKRSLAGWVHRKFGLTPDPKSWAGRSTEDVASDLKHQARELYTRKEAEFPVRVGMSRFLVEPRPGQPARYDREGLAAWASERFGTPVDVDALKPLLRPEMEAMLIAIAHETYPGGRLYEELQSRIDDTDFDDPPDLTNLANWARQELGVESMADELKGLGMEGTRNKLIGALDARYRPEMREMEKVLLLQILDQSWMEHLRTMDHLRSSVGLRGYAQVDPKVEYKREGKRIYDEMWQGVSDKITDLVFRMEQVDPDFLSYLGARWQLDRARTIKEEAPTSTSGGDPAGALTADGQAMRAQQEAGIAASQRQGQATKVEPVRNTGKKVGRNDPCPCGSGKKFKACCMKKGGDGPPF
jgi:preprotein translocase subunit SecA